MNPEEITLYHGTSYEAVKGMFEKGEIIPQGSNGSLALESPELYREDDYKGYLFFTDFLPMAVDYATMAVSNTGNYFGNVLPVLKIRVKKEELLPDVMDVKGAETWEESLEKGSQVRRKGTLPLSSIESILLVDYDNNDIVAKFQSWQEMYSYILKNKKRT